MTSKVKNYLDKLNVKYEIAIHNNQLTVIGYFNQLTDIKRQLFNNSDYVSIVRTNTSLFRLTTLLK